MSPSILRILISVLLVAHGIGHGLGILPLFGVTLTPTHSPNSWLLTPLLGAKISGIVESILFLGALLGFVGSGLALLGWLMPPSQWQPLAIGASIVSLIGLFLFPHALPTMFNTVSAIIVDIAVLAARLWLRWPPALIDG